MISAASQSDLYAKLQETGLDLVVSSKINDRRRGSFFKGAHVPHRDLIQLFVHLSQLHRAGVPLLDSLEDVKETTENLTLRDVVFDVHKDVGEGSSLSEALASHPKIFSHVSVSLISAGEESGNIGQAFQEIIKYLKWTDEMSRRVRKALRYPMVILFVVLSVIVAMMGFVVPQIVGFLDGFGKELPSYTLALISTAEFFKSYWLFVLLFPLICFLSIRLLRAASKSFALLVDRVFYSLPVIGSVARKITIARFCQTLGSLFSSGVTILLAISSARKTIRNSAMDQAILSVEENMQQGMAFSEALRACGEFPTMVVRMVKVGEETGSLKEVLDQVTEFYNDDVDDEVQNMISAIEPSLTVVLGCIILWIAVAVFAPIYASLGEIGY